MDQDEFVRMESDMGEFQALPHLGDKADSSQSWISGQAKGRRAAWRLKSEAAVQDVMDMGGL